MAKSDCNPPIGQRPGSQPLSAAAYCLDEGSAKRRLPKPIAIINMPIHGTGGDPAGKQARLAADWERARTAVFAQLVAGIGSFHDAEDVLQEVAVSVAKNYGTYDPDRPFIAWALGIARNHMLMYFRKHQRDRLVFNEQLLSLIGRHLESLSEEPTDLRREALHNCLNQLDASRRRLIEMRYTSGLSVVEMAKRLDKSVAAVKGSLHRVRKALEQCVSLRLSKAVR